MNEDQYLKFVESIQEDVDNYLQEKWSTKYKRSIDCSHPKGFSQKAHCAGRKNNEASDPEYMSEEFIESLDEDLRKWFSKHKDKRTGETFRGWINCRTGGPCSSKSKGGKYPACRPTHQQCKKIKNKIRKKTGPSTVQWKDKAS